MFICSFCAFLTLLLLERHFFLVNNFNRNCLHVFLTDGQLSNKDWLGQIIFLFGILMFETEKKLFLEKFKKSSAGWNFSIQLSISFCNFMTLKIFRSRFSQFRWSEYCENNFYKMPYRQIWWRNTHFLTKNHEKMCSFTWICRLLQAWCISIKINA